MNEKVIVCISTYNGIKYFEEQINSILSQSVPDIEILIRDDGSTDPAFIALLKKTASFNPKIKVVFGQNLGLTNSFFELLETCPKDCSYVALADQDDVWKKDRLRNSIEFIKKYANDAPFLSLCKYDYVNEDLKYISTVPTFKNLGFKNALVQNLATGCSICFNNLALKKLLVQFPKQAVIHDWWIYLVVSATGKVMQEPFVSVLYRQHSLNVLGGSTSFYKKIIKRVNRKLHQLIYQVYLQLEEFYHIYSKDMSPEKKESVLQLLRTKDSVKAKLLFLFTPRTVLREKPLDRILLKLVILLSKTKLQVQY